MKRHKPDIQVAAHERESGRIIDGTGNLWYYGDIGILGDRIVSAGKVLKKQR